MIEIGYAVRRLEVVKEHAAKGEAIQAANNEFFSSVISRGGSWVMFNTDNPGTHPLGEYMEAREDEAYLMVYRRSRRRIHITYKKPPAERREAMLHVIGTESSFDPEKLLPMRHNRPVTVIIPQGSTRTLAMLPFGETVQHFITRCAQGDETLPPFLTITVHEKHREAILRMKTGARVRVTVAGDNEYIFHKVKVEFD